jgi:hypothetical protein
LSLLILSLSVTACAKAPSSGFVLPPVGPYSAEVQTKAADELDAMGPPCPHDVVITGCSAVHRMIIDYKDMRDRTRAISGD